MKTRIEDLFNQEVKSIKELSKKTFLVLFNDNTQVIMKKREKPNKMYRYLKGLDGENIIFPFKFLEYENEIYYIFPYIKDIKTIPSQSVLELKDKLAILHSKTSVLKKMDKKEFKKLYRLYKKLDYKFRTLELLVRESEIKEKKNDFDWVILSKYKIFLDTKKELYHLQTKIHEAVDEKKSVFYGINHGKPSKEHLISSKLISFDNSYFGFIVSDIARFYVLNEYIQMSWLDIIKEWLDRYEDPIYKIHFKFLVLYIYMLNLHIDVTSHHFTIDNYIFIEGKLLKALTIFKEFH